VEFLLLEEDLLEPLSRSLIKPVILGVLEKGERHGYSLMSELKRLTGRKVGPNILYPALRDLELRGYVRGMWVSHGRRRLKKYLLTKKGKALLDKFREYLSSLLQELSS